MDKEHDLYIDFLQNELLKTHGAKIKMKDPVDAVIRILDTVLNGNGRNFVFMFPKHKGEIIELTIGDINNENSSCVIIAYENINRYIKIKDTSSKYGKCALTETFKPKTVVKVFEIDDAVPLELINKIDSDVYKNIKIA